jgi:hypothetical protein
MTDCTIHWYECLASNHEWQGQNSGSMTEKQWVHEKVRVIVGVGVVVGARESGCTRKLLFRKVSYGFGERLQFERAESNPQVLSVSIPEVVCCYVIQTVLLYRVYLEEFLDSLFRKVVISKS